MSRFLRAEYFGLEEYTPGEQPRDKKYIKLNTNESPYPPSEAAIALAKEELSRLNLYPDPTCARLREAVARDLDVLPENVFLGNGSDEILSFSFMAFFAGLPILYPEISYGFYRVYADLYGCIKNEAPLKGDFSIDVADYIEKNKNIVIANPNAPTGILLSVGEIEEIVKTNRDNIVLVDEAYIDFGGESCVALIKKYDNLIVSRTFSKSRSLAGARLGYGVASKEIISDLEKIKYSVNPYNISRASQAAGFGAIEDIKYFEDCRDKIIKNREYTAGELKKLGFTLTDSKANFVFAKHSRISGRTLYEKLKDEGVLIRHFDNPKIADYSRITIGTKEETDIMISKIEKILSSGGAL